MLNSRDILLIDVVYFEKKFLDFVAYISFLVTSLIYLGQSQNTFNSNLYIFYGMNGKF